MKEKIALVVAFFTVLTFAQSQVTFQPRQMEEAKGIVYNEEFTVDLKFLQTNGFSIGANSSKIKTYYKTTFYHFDFGELKHIREYRQQSFGPGGLNGLSGGNSYVFGKQNNLYTIRAGYGQKRYFSEKAKKKGLAVGMIYEIGPTLGLLKPYYLDLAYTTDVSGTPRNVDRSERYSSSNHDIFLNRSVIQGATGFSKGLSELSVIPGVHAQVAAHFDWGAFDEFVKALEAGIMIDVFLREAPIMVEVDGIENSPIFINVFINLQLGKRW